jgi:hypothetical protein
MLKVVGLAEYHGQIERYSDDYAPPILSVRLGGKDMHLEPAVRWRVEPLPAASAEPGFVDVWVRRSDGSVRDIECICLRRDWIEFVDDGFRFLGEGIRGLPTVDMKLWDGPGVQIKAGGTRPAIVERIPIRLFVGKDAYSFQIGGATDTNVVIEFDRFRLGLDHNRNLRRIDVVDVSAKKIQAIREYRESPPGGIPPMKGGLPRRVQWKLGMLLRQLRWEWLLRRSG